MTKSVLSFVLLVIAWALPAVPAQAQTRVFVAAQGSDANPCTFALPCRTFQHAHDVVASNGEIDVLDPAGYGAVTITKAISIQGHGYSGISTSGGATAVVINAGANDKISLRGLVLEGFGTGQNGIVFLNGKSLVVQDCAIRNFAGDAIQFKPQNPLPGFPFASTLNVLDTLLADNGGSGIFVNPNLTLLSIVRVTIRRVEASNNGGDGIFLSGIGNHIQAHIIESKAANNGSFGFELIGGDVQALIERSAATGNLGAGLSVASFIQAGPLVTLTGSTFWNNFNADIINGGTAINPAFITSLGDNVFDGVSGTIGNMPKK